MSLTSLNGDYFKLNPISVNNNVTALELALYRLIFMLLNYMVGYISHPKRIIRTLRNVFSDDLAETVLEHRIKDALKRRRLVSAQE